MTKRIPRRAEVLSSLRLPELTDLEELPQPGDAIVVCAGFEDRAVGLAETLCERKCGELNTTIVEYLPVVAENRGPEIAKLAARFSNAITFVSYDRENPCGIADNEVERIARQLPGQGRLFVDISGMSRFLIVQILFAAFRCGLGERLSVIYAEALEYPPSELDVRAVTDLMGDND